MKLRPVGKEEAEASEKGRSLAKSSRDSPQIPRSVKSTRAPSTPVSAVTPPWAARASEDRG
jgi:hypothetical protein